MNPLIQSKNTTILSVLIALTLGCFGLAPQARAVCQEGCLDFSNTVLGEDALLFITGSGNFNTAIGSEALKFTTGGCCNTATGYAALFANTDGFQNTANGHEALAFNDTGFQNTATGAYALNYNNTGVENTASGAYSLYYSDGSYNTATGTLALATTTGNYNTATGHSALFFNSGNNNTATGYQAGGGGGNNNTATGYQALLNNATGSSNIALGYLAGENLTTGNNNIDIGNSGVVGESNTIRIGQRGTQTATYIAGIWQASIADAPVVISKNGKLGIRASSARFKQAIKSMDKASEAILELKPVTFRYKQELDPDGIPQFGLVAEEVEKVNPDLVACDAKGEVYTVRYEAINAMLLNEFLKEHRKNEEQESTIKQQEAKIARQQKQIDALSAGLQKVSAQLELSKAVPQTVKNTD